MWRHVKPILQVIIFVTTMLVSFSLSQVLDKYILFYFQILRRKKVHQKGKEMVVEMQTG